MRWAAIALTEGALETAARLKRGIGSNAQKFEIYSGKRLEQRDSVRIEGDFIEFVGGIFSSFDVIVFVSACGIAVRSVAPLLVHKSVDPAVVVIDERASFAISLVSGHLGGANDAAELASRALGAQSVITTASDVCESLAVDTLAKRLGCEIDSLEDAKTVTAMALQGARIAVVSDVEIGMQLPGNFEIVQRVDPKRHAAAIIVSGRLGRAAQAGGDSAAQALIIPKRIVLGVGCRRGTREAKITGLASRLLFENKIDERAVMAVASIDIKRDESGIIEAARRFSARTEFYSAQQITECEMQFEQSEFVKSVTGAGAVCEPCGYLASSGGRLIAPRTAQDGVTISIWEAEAGELDMDKKGKIYIVGIGPGGEDHMTFAAARAIQDSKCVVGYRTYTDMIEGLTKGKRVFSSGMKKEIERCNAALELAQGGDTVSLVSSGDCGVYGMAGIMIQLVQESGEDIEFEVVPGVTAANSAAACLGAPIMHDYVTISLSDLMTDWELIRKRLHCAGQGDFVVCIYNPKSRGRKTHIEEARRILLEYRPGTTPVGIVKNAKRDGEKVEITTLEDMLSYEIDMLTTVIVGNSGSYSRDDAIVTPRGYRI